MPLDTFEYQPGADARACLIVLHGLGASPLDFVSFVNELDLAAVGPVRFVFPAAPQRPVTINNGMSMPAWYDVRSFGGTIARQEDEAGLRQSAADIQALVEREIARGMPASRIVLGGFSQGAAITLLAGLRTPHRLAGLLGMSGYLPLADTTAGERSDASRGVPIFLGHGRQDPVVPAAAGQATRDKLLALGDAVEWHDYPMEHAVSPQEIRDIEAWLLKVLAA